MPLLDHLRPPVKGKIQWTSFHSNWATRIADQLTELMPEDNAVEEHPRLSGGVEIDNAATKDAGLHTNGVKTNPWRSEWQPPTPGITTPALYPEKFEVLVFNLYGGRKLVAAVELISPANKDRPDERVAFASKVASYLHEGVGVLIVDVVTERTANLHNEIVRLMHMPNDVVMPPEPPLYAVSYRPVVRHGTPQIDVWVEAFEIGNSLPTMPLRIVGDWFVPVDLESTYMEACRRRRLI